MRRASILAVLVLTVFAVGGLGWWAWDATSTSGRAGDRVERSDDRALPQGDWYVGALAEPADLNPFTTQEATARRYVLRYSHDTLMDLDPETGEPRPALASAVKSSADGREHVFTLRGDLRFSDGSPVTIEDVLFTFRACAAPGVVLGAAAEMFGLIESANALDDDRLRLVLRAASPRAFGIVATGYFVTQRAFFEARIGELAQRAGRDAPSSIADPAFGELLSQVRLPGPGTGPYVVADEHWRRGVELSLVRNETSWRRAASPRCWNLDGLRLRFLTDRAAQVLALRRQEIDWLIDPDPATLLADPELAAHYRSLVYDQVHVGYYAILWNHRRPPLDDARVRRALTMCTDRDALIAGVFHGHAEQAPGWFRLGAPELPADLEPLPFDPTAARALLAAARGDAVEPLRLGLVHAAGDETQDRIAQFVRPAFARAGITLELEPLAWPALVDRLGRREFDGLLVTVSAERWVDPYPYCHSSQVDARNWTSWRDPEIDDLLERARNEADPERARELYRQFNRRFAMAQPMTLLLHPLTAVVLHRRFQGVMPGRLGLVPEAWWVEPTERRYP